MCIVVVVAVGCRCCASCCASFHNYFYCYRCHCCCCCYRCRYNCCCSLCMILACMLLLLICVFLRLDRGGPPLYTNLVTPKCNQKGPDPFGGQCCAPVVSRLVSHGFPFGLPWFPVWSTVVSRLVSRGFPWFPVCAGFPFVPPVVSPLNFPWFMVCAGFPCVPPWLPLWLLVVFRLCPRGYPPLDSYPVGDN